MAIAFIEERKKQKKLAYFLLAVILVICFVLWLGVLRKPRAGEQVLPFLPILRKAEVNFNVLENPTLKDLQPFKEIAPFEGKMGRGNPFLPY